MAQPATSFVDESRERIHSARERIDSEFKKAQKDLEGRRKRLEKQLSKNRKGFEKQTKQLRKDLEKNSIVKQLNRWRNDAEDQFEDVLGSLLGSLQIATQSDVKKIDRRLSKISRQLKELDASKQSPESQ
ncbi:MAG: hypothetical protein JRH16_17030 [Deltaproteobacteria bacterium]|nr:hypothetical protein [Deltaproteobacteria bacterium]MBW2359703.1 hypothetical protein [Deltaproteobacteria bacterium]